MLSAKYEWLQLGRLQARYCTPPALRRSCRLRCESRVGTARVRPLGSTCAVASAQILGRPERRRDSPRRSRKAQRCSPEISRKRSPGCWCEPSPEQVLRVRPGPIRGRACSAGEMVWWQLEADVNGNDQAWWRGPTASSLTDAPDHPPVGPAALRSSSSSSARRRWKSWTASSVTCPWSGS